MKVINLHQEEKELIELAVENNRHAQHQIYSRYAPKMLSVCRQYIKDVHQAEDIMITAFMKVFTSLKNFLLICQCGASFTVNTFMKYAKNTLLLLLLVISQITQAQKDEALEKRLKEFLVFNETMQIDKVLDYTYPKLFTIAPKAQMLEAMQNAFDNESSALRS